MAAVLGWGLSQILESPLPECAYLYQPFGGHRVLGHRGRGMPFLPLSWAARVKPLDNKADGNLCSDLWETKKSSVLFSPGLNTTLRDIFVFTAATPPRPQKNVQPDVETHLTTTYRDGFHSCTKPKGPTGLIVNPPSAFF